jgi:hypothetical protein
MIGAVCQISHSQKFASIEIFLFNLAAKGV